uniref:AlNc14C5G782 protein n=1 Tax=Albugo laibachii Nc14 TaxID=890382 RepID=F0W102_9STRA|nr:AlNc14C5G782 [Albugo laibachii Nc14]|eukprot:CCA14726.1 AlNc14C5G782 [Albugo laibachii Nc14]
METITSQVIASLTARLKPITDTNEDSRGRERAVYLTLLPVLIPAIISLLITLEKVQTDEKKTKPLNPMEFIARFLLRNNISACKPLV